MVLAIILLVLLGFSMLYNVGHFFRGLAGHPGGYARLAGPKLEEITIQENNTASKIAVIEVNGIITGQPTDGGYSMVDLIRAQLKRAEDDPKVRAVILRVDSPGGEVLASDEIFNAISEFQDKAEKPVVASMGNLAASGGYYISAPCRWIVANELTITGSIGVIMQTYNYRALMDKVGVVPQVYKSGQFKDMLSGSRDLSETSDEERGMVKKLIAEVYGKFKEAVAEGRQNSAAANRGEKEKGQSLAADWTEYADGRVFSGTEAFKLGFVDELGNFEDAVRRTRKLANMREATLIQYQQRLDFSDLFRMLGKTETPVVKLDLGMEAPKIQAGRLYFLAPTFAH